MSSIITGEAVVLELRPASFAARALGLLLDVLFNIILLVLILLGVAAAGQDLDEAAMRALTLVSVVFCFVIVPVSVETLTRGLSLGKLAAGLRVVRDDGGAIRFRHAVIRGLTGFLEIYLTVGGLAIGVALFNSRSKRLGDILAGTYALRRRVPAEVPVRVFVPHSFRAGPQLRTSAGSRMRPHGRPPNSSGRPDACHRCPPPEWQHRSPRNWPGMWPLRRPLEPARSSTWRPSLPNAVTENSRGCSRPGAGTRPRRSGWTACRSGHRPEPGPGPNRS
ncbi:conserved hypothetical protein [Arthrobacter sp. Hiyo4]|nr:conserved hypothetical protein [Arthrobacter sp. Hiyo4]